ncbi:hypothetical protein K7I13_06350 [Brucepastera parasyntrophica]|nr:hypothetical protein K7I13_06350 [Brucepastera parasyntrophica]
MSECVIWHPDERTGPDGNPFSIVDAVHWYDGPTLLLKKWRPVITADSLNRSPVIGKGATKENIKKQIAEIADRPRSKGVASFIGEFGVPFDLDDGKSYRTGDYSAQEEALGVYYDGIDAALVHSTIWNYSASNTHEHGDGWNKEDLSIYSASTGEGRAVKGFCRPYAMAIAGIPVLMQFDQTKREFILEWEAVPGVTEIFVPEIWYPEGWEAELESLLAKIDADAVMEKSPEKQRLYITLTRGSHLRVRVFPLSV